LIWTLPEEEGEEEGEEKKTTMMLVTHLPLKNQEWMPKETSKLLSSNPTFQSQQL
jgi:hypothetical protein